MNGRKLNQSEQIELNIALRESFDTAIDSLVKATINFTDNTIIKKFSAINNLITPLDNQDIIEFFTRHPDKKDLYYQAIINAAINFINLNTDESYDNETILQKLLLSPDVHDYIENNTELKHVINKIQIRIKSNTAINSSNEYNQTSLANFSNPNNVQIVESYIKWREANSLRFEEQLQLCINDLKQRAHFYLQLNIKKTVLDKLNDTLSKALHNIKLIIDFNKGDKASSANQASDHLTRLIKKYNKSAAHIKRCQKLASNLRLITEIKDEQLSQHSETAEFVDNLNILFEKMIASDMSYKQYKNGYLMQHEVSRVKQNKSKMDIIVKSKLNSLISISDKLIADSSHSTLHYQRSQSLTNLTDSPKIRVNKKANSDPVKISTPESEPLLMHSQAKIQQRLHEKNEKSSSGIPNESAASVHFEKPINLMLNELRPLFNKYAACKDRAQITLVSLEKAFIKTDASKLEKLSSDINAMKELHPQLTKRMELIISRVENFIKSNNIKIITNNKGEVSQNCDFGNLSEIISAPTKYFQYLKEFSQMSRLSITYEARYQHLKSAFEMTNNTITIKPNSPEIKKTL